MPRRRHGRVLVGRLVRRRSTSTTSIVRLESSRRNRLSRASFRTVGGTRLAVSHAFVPVPSVCLYVGFPLVICSLDCDVIGFVKVLQRIFQASANEWLPRIRRASSLDDFPYFKKKLDIYSYLSIVLQLSPLDTNFVLFLSLCWTNTKHHLRSRALHTLAVLLSSRHAATPSGLLG